MWAQNDLKRGPGCQEAAPRHGIKYFLVKQLPISPLWDGEAAPEKNIHCDAIRSEQFQKWHFYESTLWTTRLDKFWIDSDF